MAHRDIHRRDLAAEIERLVVDEPGGEDEVVPSEFAGEQAVDGAAVGDVGDAAHRQIARGAEAAGKIHHRDGPLGHRRGGSALASGGQQAVEEVARVAGFERLLGEFRLPEVCVIEACPEQGFQACGIMACEADFQRADVPLKACFCIHRGSLRPRILYSENRQIFQHEFRFPPRKTVRPAFEKRSDKMAFRGERGAEVLGKLIDGAETG